MGIEKLKHDLAKVESLKKRVKKHKEDKYGQPRTTQTYRVLNGMQQDLDYAIRWLEQGREPSKKNGGQKLSRRRREITVSDEELRNIPADDLIDPLNLPTDEHEEFREFWENWHNYTDDYGDGGHE